MIATGAVGVLFLLTLWFGMGLMNAEKAGQPRRVWLWVMALEWAAVMVVAAELITP